MSTTAHRSYRLNASAFSMTAAQEQAALIVLREAIRQRRERSAYQSHRDILASCTDTFLCEAQRLTKLLQLFGWSVISGSDGTGKGATIQGIFLSTQDLREINDFFYFRVIASFVAPRSYIHLESEDGEHCLLTFTGVGVLVEFVDAVHLEGWGADQLQLSGGPISYMAFAGLSHWRRSWQCTGRSLREESLFMAVPKR
jgi:hypothetical protein